PPLPLPDALPISFQARTSRRRPGRRVNAARTWAPAASTPRCQTGSVVVIGLSWQQELPCRADPQQRLFFLGVFAGWCCPFEFGDGDRARLVLTGDTDQADVVEDDGARVPSLCLRDHFPCRASGYMMGTRLPRADGVLVEVAVDERRQRLGRERGADTPHPQRPD